MTTWDALDAIETALTSIGLVDKFGERALGIEAAAYVRKRNPDAWDRAEEEFYHSRITPAQYAVEIITLIEQVKKERKSA